MIKKEIRKFSIGLQYVLLEMWKVYVIVQALRPATAHATA